MIHPARRHPSQHRSGLLGLRRHGQTCHCQWAGPCGHGVASNSSQVAVKFKFSITCSGYWPSSTETARRRARRPRPRPWPGPAGPTGSAACLSHAGPGSRFQVQVKLIAKLSKPTRRSDMASESEPPPPGRTDYYVTSSDATVPSLRVSGSASQPGGRLSRSPSTTLRPGIY